MMYIPNFAYEILKMASYFTNVETWEVDNVDNELITY